MDGNEKAIQSFLDSKKGTSAATQEHYEKRLKHLLIYLKKNKISIDKFKQKDLIDFLGKSYAKFKPKTMNHIKSVLVAFLKYNFPKDYFSRFPNLTNICKSQKVMPTYNSEQMLSEKEVEQIIQKEHDPFWKCAFAIQFYGGCRPSEVCQLKWKDITFTSEGVFFKIYSKKNNKNFEKFVPNEFSFYLKEMQKNSTSEYCFSKFNDKPIHRSTFHYRLVNLGKKVFPNKHINPYLLRHSIATILYKRSRKGELDSGVVAEQMGHSVSMEKVYAHYDLETLRDCAKNIYIKAEYTPEKKAELEKELEEVKKELAISGRFMQLSMQLQEKKITAQEYKKEMENLANISAKLWNIKSI